MILLALFVIGAQVGSFLNVCIWRLPRGENVAYPPSHCPGCNRQLKALDMVPIVSQLVLRARCRYCKTRIAWRYAGIELLTAVLFVLIGAQAGNIDGGWWAGSWAGDGLHLTQMLVVVSCLVVVFWIDFETLMIPISAALLIGLAGVGCDAWRVWQGQAALTDGAFLWFHLLPAPLPGSLLAMAGAAAAVALLRALASWYYDREAMGFGDVFLVGAIAANIGWSELIVTFFFLAVFIALAGGLLLHTPRVVRAYRRARVRDVGRRERGLRALAPALARHSFRKLEMPFGPSLAVAAVVTLLYGGSLTASYRDWAHLDVAAAAPLALPPPPPYNMP